MNTTHIVPEGDAPLVKPYYQVCCATPSGARKRGFLHFPGAYAPRYSSDPPSVDMQWNQTTETDPNATTRNTIAESHLSVNFFTHTKQRSTKNIPRWATAFTSFRRFQASGAKFTCKSFIKYYSVVNTLLSNIVERILDILIILPILYIQAFILTILIILFILYIQAFILNNPIILPILYIQAFILDIPIILPIPYIQAFILNNPIILPILYIQAFILNILLSYYPVRPVRPVRPSEPNRKYRDRRHGPASSITSRFPHRSSFPSWMPSPVRLDQDEYWRYSVSWE